MQMSVYTYHTRHQLPRSRPKLNISPRREKKLQFYITFFFAWMFVSEKKTYTTDASIQPKKQINENPVCWIITSDIFTHVGSLFLTFFFFLSFQMNFYVFHCAQSVLKIWFLFKGNTSYDPFSSQKRPIVLLCSFFA